MPKLSTLNLRSTILMKLLILIMKLRSVPKKSRILSLSMKNDDAGIVNENITEKEVEDTIITENETDDSVTENEPTHVGIIEEKSNYSHNLRRNKRDYSKDIERINNAKDYSFFTKTKMLAYNVKDENVRTIFLTMYLK